MGTWPPLTIAECDERLEACVTAMRTADLDGDDLTVEAMRDTIDELLERRLHIPQQRRASD